MLENETSIKVSDEELLNDIKNTALELEAYQKIASGFAILRDLPENRESGVFNKMNFEVMKYTHSESKCAEFLRTLYALKAEREKRHD